MAKKYTYEEKLNIVEGYLNGDFTLSEKAHGRNDQRDCRESRSINRNG